MEFTLRVVRARRRKAEASFTRHFAGIEGGVQLVFSEAKFLKTFRAQLSDRSARFDGFLRDLAGLIVADNGCQ